MGGFLQSCAFRRDPGKTPHMNRESWNGDFCSCLAHFFGWGGE